MKGIIKGSMFSVVLIAIMLCILSTITMYIDIPSIILKGILWTCLGLCVFAGCVPVALSATSKKLLRGMGCSFISIFIIWVVACIAGKSIPMTASFYSMALICFICGILGTFTGARK